MTHEGGGYARLDEEQDFTGDSGFVVSGSSKFYDDSDPYCVVDLWRRLPPTNTEKATEKKGSIDNKHKFGMYNTA